MNNNKYNLLALAGVSPAVVTETIWALHQNRGLEPATVCILTTSVGASRLSDTMIGGADCPISSLGKGRGRFLDLEFGLEIHVPETENGPLEDVRSRTDDAAMLRAVHNLVTRFTLEDELPLMASLAGGRKTMSGHLQSAFTVRARPQDRLLHILVSPPQYETPGFWHPTESTPDARLDLIDMLVPRWRPALEGDVVLKNLGQSSIEEHLQILNYELEPDALHLDLGGEFGNSRLVFRREGEQVAHIEKVGGVTTGILLALLEAQGRDGDCARTSDLITPEMSGLRAKLTTIGGSTAPVGWEQPGDVSKGINQLSKALKLHPLADRFLTISRHKLPLKEEPAYKEVCYSFPVWAVESVTLSVRPGAIKHWPCRHLPEPEIRG